MSFKETLTELTLLATDPRPIRCACCGAVPSLWELDRDGTVTKMVNCNTAELLPDDPNRPLVESCPMYSPGMAFNKATRREAITYWNWFNEKLVQLRTQAAGVPA